MKKIMLLFISLIFCATTASAQFMPSPLYQNHNAWAEGFKTPLAFATDPITIPDGYDIYRGTSPWLLSAPGFSYEMKQQAISGDEATIIVFPDIQNMTVQIPPDIWGRMYGYVVAQKTAQNIAAVFSTGDQSNNRYVPGYEAALTGFTAIRDAGIPIMPILGNHDYDDYTIESRASTAYDAYFGTTFFSGQSWFGGSYEVGNPHNYYTTFTAAGIDFLALCLEFYPRDEVITWAQSIITANPDKVVIIATHAFIDSYGHLIEQTGEWAPSRYHDCGNGGLNLWAQLVSLNKNVAMVISGHMTATPYMNYVVKVGAYGQTVYAIKPNWQDDTEGGNGYFLKIKITPVSRRLTLETYSTETELADPRFPEKTLAFCPPIKAVEPHDHGGMWGWKEVGFVTYNREAPADKTIALDGTSPRLRIDYYARTNTGTSSTLLQFNGDTDAAHYITSYTQQDGATLSGAQVTNSAGFQIADITAAGDTYSGSIECSSDIASMGFIQCRTHKARYIPTNTDLTNYLENGTFLVKAPLVSLTLDHAAGSTLTGTFRVYQWVRFE